MYLVRSGAIDGYEKRVAELGGNPVQLLAECGLTPAQLRDPDTYVSYRAVADVLELTALRCQCDFFGLELAQRQDATVLGDMVMSVFRQPSLQAALDAVERNLFLHARGVRLLQQPGEEDTLLRLELDFHGDRGLSQLLQLSAVHLAHFVADAVSAGGRPSMALVLRQRAPGGMPPLPSKVARIEFAAAADGVRFPSRWLQRQPRFHEEVLGRHLQGYLASLSRRYPDKLCDQVRDLIRQFLPSSECSVERVAASLDLHPRVLQQRLRKQGSTYGALLRDVRSDLARQLLSQPGTSVTELALRLGYADVSVFSRSFRKWTGVSPRQWQRQHAV